MHIFTCVSVCVNVSVSEISEPSVYFSTGSMSGKWETERARECSDGELLPL